MYTEHDLFKPPENIDQKIWRYLDITKLLDLINSNSLYFARSDCFEDRFEGSLPKRSVESRTKFYEMLGKIFTEPDYSPEFWDKSNQELKKEIGLNCWHMNDFESAAMWKLYLKSNEGIAVQSTYKRLVDSFNSSKIPIMVGVVNYINYETDFIPTNNSLWPFLHKRKSFIHEQELRCLIWQTDPNSENLEKGGIKIKLDLENLIENIYLSPSSPAWLTVLVQDILKKYELNIAVINSRLDDLPLF